MVGYGFIHKMVLTVWTECGQVETGDTWVEKDPVNVGLRPEMCVLCSLASKEPNMSGAEGACGL